MPSPPGIAHLADLVLLVMLGEWIALSRGGRGCAMATTALLPGALLVLALRAALAGTHGLAMLLPLTLSLPAHLLDLRARGRSATDREDRRRDPGHEGKATSTRNALVRYGGLRFR